MAFNDSDLRFNHPEVFRNDDIDRTLARERLAKRPGLFGALGLGPSRRR